MHLTRLSPCLSPTHRYSSRPDARVRMCPQCVRMYGLCRVACMCSVQVGAAIGRLSHLNGDTSFASSDAGQSCSPLLESIHEHSLAHQQQQRLVTLSQVLQQSLIHNVLAHSFIHSRHVQVEAKERRGRREYCLRDGYARPAISYWLTGTRRRISLRAPFV